ncbi:hypothetical protein TUM20985_47800 [Mycobacterium antarcticum]|uniref:hypothetical protein n=1 Tax=unclassified Mycolicibacterium TaxID=2636767 RepID=UPI00238932F7|nr:MULTISPECIES: hypothetical protein [unclassified Mycolicibacterium]BDX34233.1 hypothetical protein TUM20985_47800 [Mycolicibacterium sp. TUM20985]GLP77435.1 hypothetical protein TUM20983_45450 [Mycolicibacterium sp. TUM20983]GLP82161.1 hypothetical protein TUM20984_35810 [Mycolicibacterium sp. TUM20984]
MSTVATRFTKFQVGAAAAALTAATVLTPVAISPTMAYAAPSISSFTEGVGAGVTSLVSPVVTLAAPAAAADPCAGVDFSVGCYAVAGFAAGTQAIVRGAVVFIGTAAYVVAQGTGQIFKVIGSFIPGPVGAFFTSVGDGVSAFANTIAITFQVGPYQTAQ